MKPMKKTNRKQFERLVELMKQNPEFAAGHYRPGILRPNVKQKWKEFAAVLNLLGPPTRPGHEWQRVWIDMKGKVKKVLSRNMQELRAGGEAQPIVHSLSPLQQEIDELLQYSAIIKVEQLADECGPSVDHEPNGQLAASPASSESDETAQPSRNPRRAGKRKRRQPFEDERYALLTKQTKLMQQSVQQMAVIGENVAKLVGALNQQTLVLKQAVKLMEKNMEKRQ
ncbi:uncharacterized protein LOC126579783 [Anopheles aquasalis]|uniref:uncharacterized protein LOC126579783 n=1 Tax=Anopheles aquasalis TaxID=42839 RepID=UPI00215AE315|nr:uncharacterized protein LOC126579783 [Anopheles aquasalis]